MCEWDLRSAYEEARAESRVRCPICKGDGGFQMDVDGMECCQICDGVGTIPAPVPDLEGSE